MPATDREEAGAALPGPLWGLFLEMSDRDQRHSLEVLRRLRNSTTEGRVEPVLAHAALLHDVGKARAPLGVPGRSLLVLAEACGGIAVLLRVPGLGRRVARYMDHPAIGAEMLRSAGASPALVEVVGEHQRQRPERAETLRLQGADGQE